MNWKIFIYRSAVLLCVLGGASTAFAQAAQNQVIWTDGDDQPPFYFAPPAATGTAIPLDDGSVYWPAAGTEQAVRDELWTNTVPNCEGERCFTGMEPDDPDAQALMESSSLDATASTAAPGATIEPAPATPQNQPIEKTFHKDDAFGNGTFGSSYSVDGTLLATPVSGVTGVAIAVTGTGVANARAFSISKEVGRARLSLMSNRTGESRLQVFLLGDEVFATTIATGNTRYEKIMNREFFSATIPVTLFGVRLDVTGAAGGNFGATYDGTFNSAGSFVTFAPQAGVFVSLSVAFSVGIGNIARITIGAKGTLTLLNVEFPLYLKIGAVSCNNLEWLVGSDLKLTTMSGKLSVFAKVKLLFIKKKKEFTVAKFTGSVRGFSRTISLATAGTTVPFVLVCSDALRSDIAVLTTLPPPPAPPAPPRSPPRNPGYQLP